MSLLPAAMRLPDDITPLGKKVVPPAPPQPLVIDPVKAFEKLPHPFPDGRQCPVEKPFFSFDFGDGDGVSTVSFKPGEFQTILTRQMKALLDDAMLTARPPVVLASTPRLEAACEVMKQKMDASKEAAVGINKDYSTPWPTSKKRQLTFDDLDVAVASAAKRSGFAERTVVRMVKNRFGGTVRDDQVWSAIDYANAIVDDCPF